MWNEWVRPFDEEWYREDEARTQEIDRSAYHVALLMDPEGVAQLLDRAWWEEDDEWMASYDEKQFISTFNFHRQRLWEAGGLMFIIQANGHAKGLGALTPMAAADAGAKCGAERATPSDPVAVRLRCGMVTVEAVDERGAAASEELVYTPASTGTKLYTHGTRRLTAAESCDRVEKDDEERGGARGGDDDHAAAIDRLQMGLRTDEAEAAEQRADRASGAGEEPEARPWPGLAKMAWSAKDVSPHDDRRTCGLGWMGAAIGCGGLVPGARCSSRSSTTEMAEGRCPAGASGAMRRTDEKESDHHHTLLLPPFESP